MSDNPFYPPEHPDFPGWNPEPEGECRWCGTAAGEPMCRATDGDYTCTREAGHAGHHAACGISEENHPVWVWQDSDAVDPDDEDNAEVTPDPIELALANRRVEDLRSAIDRMQAIINELYAVRGEDERTAELCVEALKIARDQVG